MGPGCLHGALGLLDEPSAPTRSFHQLTLACCARGPGDGGEPAWGQHGSAEPYGPGRAADPMTFPLKFVWKLHGAPRAWRPCRPGTRWLTLLGSAGPGCRPLAAWPRRLPLIMPVGPRRDLSAGQPHARGAWQLWSLPIWSILVV